MLFLAARDPARNVAILDGLIVGLCVLSVAAALFAGMLGGIYPACLIWGKAAVPLALAALLFDFGLSLGSPQQKRGRVAWLHQL